MFVMYFNQFASLVPIMRSEFLTPKVCGRPHQEINNTFLISFTLSFLTGALRRGCLPPLPLKVEILVRDAWLMHVLGCSSWESK